MELKFKLSKPKVHTIGKLVFFYILEGDKVFKRTEKLNENIFYLQLLLYTFQQKTNKQNPILSILGLEEGQR